MIKKYYIFVAVLLSFIGGGVFWWIIGQQGDDRSRIDTVISDSTGEVQPVLEVVSEQLGLIWGLDFIPGSELLLATAKTGQLYLINIDSLEVSEIANTPTVDDAGQGGLLDVAASPDFDQDSFIFLTYSAANNSGDKATHLQKAELDIDNYQLVNNEVLYIAEPFLPSNNHYGSRVVIDGNHIFMTIGDRNDKNFDDHVSQNTSNPLGSTIRLYRDGSIPEDNPFVSDPSIIDEIYSYGHRNAQGMALEPVTGDLWQSEHGERDGDEINQIVAGGNYGWPIATTGCNYGTKNQIGERPEERDDTVNPIFYWECGSGGFPPAGMAFYDAEIFSDWQGDLFVGGLAAQYLAHFTVNEDKSLSENEPLLQEESWRVRDVAVSNHDGAIYVAVEGSEISIVRITPKPITR